MAFTDQERSILQQVKEQGGTLEQARNVILKYRQQAQPIPTSTTGTETRSDIKQATQPTTQPATIPQATGEIIKGGLGVAKDIAVNVGKGIFNLGADISKIQRGTIGQDTGIPQGFVGNIAQDLSQRGQNISETVQNVQSQETSPVSGGLQTVGQFAGGITDILGEAMVSAYKTAGEPGKEQAKQVFATPQGQQALQALSQGADMWNSFKTQYPDTAKNIEAVVNIGTLLPIGKAPQIVKEAGKTLEKGLPTLPKIDTGLISKVKENLSGMKEIVKNIGKVTDEAGILGKPPISGRMPEEIAANILQPYKGVAENLPDATKGLQKVIEKKGLQGKEDFVVLAKKTDEVLQEQGKKLGETLSKIKGVKKDDSISNALFQLVGVYEGTLSKENQSILKRIAELNKKHNTKGLTASEVNEVKVLHTKANQLFSDLGKEKKGFSANDLRGIRSELKTIVEDMGKKQGIKDIAEINKSYGELADAKMLLENQKNSLTSYLGRQLPETNGQKIGRIITSIPGVRQVFTDPAKGILTTLGVSLRSDKINPLEVQRRLPQLLKELEKAGMQTGDIIKVKQGINKEFITPAKIVEKTKQVFKKAKEGDKTIKLTPKQAKPKEVKLTKPIVAEKTITVKKTPKVTPKIVEKAKPKVEKGKLVKKEDNITINNANKYLESMGLSKMTKEQENRYLLALDKGLREKGDTALGNKELNKIMKEKGHKEATIDELGKEFIKKNISNNLKSLKDKSPKSITKTLEKGLKVEGKTAQILKIVKAFIKKEGKNRTSKINFLVDEVIKKINP